MFLRIKPSGKYQYLQLAESFRDGGRVRQRVLATLGRLDLLRASGQLDSLAVSAGKLTERLAVIGAHRRGELEILETTTIGPGLVFGRLWREVGLDEVLGTLLRDRRFEFDVVAAILMTVIHRLVDPGSDRAADRWRRTHDIPGAADLDLHHLYRAMAWLGEELPREGVSGSAGLGPRCVKDLVEEQLFARRRTLFTQMVVAFFDTTSIYFEGEGGLTLGQRGHNKDGRSDCKQIVVGMILDDAGRPVCCEMWPGNTADVTTLVPVVTRLRERFGITTVTVVADRGMISEETIQALDGLDGVEYILGARLRSTKEVNKEVLGRAGRYKVVHPPRENAKDPSPLKVKEVVVNERRYVVCLNEEQARKDQYDREAILASLEAALKRGDKGLVANKGYRRYLKTPGEGFQIDEKRIRAEERLDGKWALRTSNRTMSAADVALTYKRLWEVESIFRTVKSVLATRPVFHQRDETIRGHVFCSFLALVLMRELQDRLDAHGHANAEWAHVVRDLDALTRTRVRTLDGKTMDIRSEARGWCGKTFQAAGVALPQAARPPNHEVGPPPKNQTRGETPAL